MSDRFKLEVPLDASSLKDLKHERGIKVVAYGKNVTREEVLKLDRDGRGSVTFSFDHAPGSLNVAIGPESASAQDLKNLQTISVNVPSTRWNEVNSVKLTPLAISPYYWDWWWRWCQSFKVTGRVLCPDGRPVAGATVCAFDVDWWWWWTSQDQVGCATTDVNGAFQIDFTRCCGWWPWYWWYARDWQLDPLVTEKITNLLRTSPKLGLLPTPSPKPSLDVFTQLLDSSRAGSRVRLAANAPTRGAIATASSAINPAELDGLRSGLLEIIPVDFPYPIWPWYPWWPWWDCNANLIFNVTQSCGGQVNTIVSQTIADTQWDVPTNYSVTLTANSQACCSYGCPNCPEGNCISPTDICQINVGSIGGNVGSPVLPNPQPGMNPPSLQEGLYNPGLEDRPFAGGVNFYGQFGTSADVDYYEFQYSTTNVNGPYAPLPLAALETIGRQIQVAVPPPFFFQWLPVQFQVSTLSDGVTNHYVYETIAHYETINGAQIWDTATYELLLPLNTQNVLANGTYYLRLVGYKLTGGGTITPANSGSPDPGVLLVCDPTNDTASVENYWVVTIDNQAPGNTDPSGNPLYPNPAGCPSTAGAYCQPCGSGTVHSCTNQPTTDIFRVQIVHADSSTTQVGSCGNVTINCDDTLQVDFVAYDPDAFLYEYTLKVYYGDNLVQDLLALAGSSGITPGVITTAWAPAAAQVGPDYSSALVQGATSPAWGGGSITAKMNASAALPATCSYLLQLVAYKRPIVSCDSLGNYDQYNVSEWTFAVQNDCNTTS